MSFTKPLPFVCRFLLLLILLISMLSVPLAGGEIVLIESRTTGTASGGITPNPPYEEAAGSWSGSGSHTTADGTTLGIGSRYGFGGTPVLNLHPTLIAGASYALEVAHITIN